MIQIIEDTLSEYGITGENVNLNLRRSAIYDENW